MPSSLTACAVAVPDNPGEIETLKLNDPSEWVVVLPLINPPSVTTLPSSSLSLTVPEKHQTFPARWLPMKLVIAGGDVSSVIEIITLATLETRPFTSATVYWKPSVP